LDKLLSIILCGRNDNYLGDFKYRIQTAINYMGRNCARAGLKDDIEILVVDWNGDEPLSQALKLLPDTYDICRYVSVSPDLVRSHFPGNRRFNSEAAVNVGLRRATGLYSLFVPADILITESSLFNLVAVLKGERKMIFAPTTTVLCLDRKILPWQIVEKQPTLAEWDRYIQLCGRHLFHDRYYIGLHGGYGGLLLHRNLWHECEGFVENNTGWGLSDTDWGLRMGQEYLSVSLESFGVMLYDMAQKPELMAQRKVGDTRYDNRIDLGNPNWGLGSIDLKRTMGFYSEDVSFTVEPPVRPNQETALALIRQASEQIVPTLLGGGTLPPGSTEHILLAALSWYCLIYWPSRYFEFNCHAGLSAPAYAKLCTFGELYAFDEYEDFDQAGNFQSYLDTLPHNHFYRLGFQGHAQLLTGDSSTVLDRLRESFPGELELDVAVLRCDALKTPERCLQMADDLMDALAPNGALFITAQSVDLFNSFQIPLRQKYIQHHFLHLPEQPFVLLIKADT
jgi:glycosyltransferase involved in cell wall biosynthesis